MLRVYARASAPWVRVFEVQGFKFMIQNSGLPVLGGVCMGTCPKWDTLGEPRDSEFSVGWNGSAQLANPLLRKNADSCLRPALHISCLLGSPVVPFYSASAG